MKHLIFLVFLASVILAGCTKDEVTSNNPAQPPTNPTAPQPTPFGIVDAPFLVVSLQGVADFMIEKYRTDGSVRAGLLDGYFSGYHFIADPDFSAFGEKFCYGENQAIYIVDMKTLQPQQISIPNVSAGIQSTKLSPDGSMIAYLIRNDDETLDLGVVGSAGELTPVKLTNFRSTNSSAGPPSFSPDGRKITYSESPNIVVCDPDGANKIRVTEGSQTASYPIFNNDGSRLIYFLNQDHGLALMTAEAREGAGQDQITISLLSRYAITSASHPVLSGDGGTIYFAGVVSGFTNLYRLPVSGGVPERLAFNIINSEDYVVSGLDFISWKAE